MQNNGIWEICALAYAPEISPTCKLDLVVPEDAGVDPLPCVLYIHGGGWRGGDLTDHREDLRILAAHGFAVASLGYRLSGEARWPAQIVDCQCAVRWLRAHAVKYRIDPDLIAVFGGSAGGHLAALMGLVPDDCFAEPQTYTAYGGPPRAVITAAGPSDLSDTVFLDHFPEIETCVEALLGFSPREHPEAARSASPIAHVHHRAPPFCVAHGSCDRAVHVSQAIALGSALAEAGADPEIWIAQGVDHGFDPGRETEAWDRARDFLDRHLHGNRQRAAQGDSTE